MFPKKIQKVEKSRNGMKIKREKEGNNEKESFN